MDKEQNSKNRMHRAVSGILDSNQQIVITIPGLNEAHQALDNLIAIAAEQHQGQSNNGTELTAGKNNTRLTMNLIFKKVSRAVVAYATNSKDATEKLLKDKHRYSDSEIDKMKDKDIFNNAYILYGDAEPIADKLVPFATKEDVTQLKEDADELYLRMPQRRVQLSKSSTSTQNLEEAIKQADKLIKETIDLLVNPLEFMYPDFFKSYQNARIIVDPAYRKRKQETTVKADKQES